MDDGIDRSAMKLVTTSIQIEKQSDLRDLQVLAEEIPGVINLAMDQSDFGTPEFIREAVNKALDDRYASNLPVRGFMDLRVAIAAKLKAENNIDADPNTDILVAVGTTQIVFSVCRLLIGSSDEVIMVDPGPNYSTHIRPFGGIPVMVPIYEANGFKADPENIRTSVTNKTKLIILNTPANPTGAIMDEKVLDEVRRTKVTDIAIQIEVDIDDEDAPILEKCKKIMQRGCLITYSLEDAIDIDYEITRV